MIVSLERLTYMHVVPVSHITDYRDSARGGADIYSLDQFASSTANSLGRDAVSSGKSAAQSSLDHSQATAALGNSNGGHRPGRVDARAPHRAQRVVATPGPRHDAPHRALG